MGPARALPEPCQSVTLALLPRGSPSVWDLAVPGAERSWLQDSRRARALLLQPWGPPCVPALPMGGTFSPHISATREGPQLGH